MIERSIPHASPIIEYAEIDSGNVHPCIRIDSNLLLALPYYQQGVSLSPYEKRVINVLSTPYGKELVARAHLGDLVILPIGRVSRYGALWKAPGIVRMSAAGEAVFVLNYDLPGKKISPGKEA